MGNSNEFMCLLQVKIHEEHPEYGFDGHKGYGTKAHMEALQGAEQADGPALVANELDPDVRNRRRICPCKLNEVQESNKMR